MRQYKRFTALILAAILTLSLTATAFAWEYTVENRDTLWDIAAEQLGSGYKWTDLYKANRDTIKNPDLIYAGQVIHIPDSQSAPQESDQSSKPADSLSGIAGDRKSVV